MIGQEIIEEPKIASTQSNCFGCGTANNIGLQLVFIEDAENSVSCETQIASSFDGHPGYVHGGIIATMLDEAMIKALRVTGRTGVTSRLQIEYLRPVPSSTLIRIEGRLLRSEQNRHMLETKVKNRNGRILAQGTGTIVGIKPRT